jgi:hypothetical protein
MIGVARGVSVFAYAEACGMRKSFDTLAALVTEELKRDVLAGDLYLFVGKDRKRAKVLYFDGTGLCVYANQPSSHYTSSDLIRVSWHCAAARCLAARSATGFHRLHCFTGAFGPGSS